VPEQLNLPSSSLDTSKWRALSVNDQVCALALTEAADMGVVFAASDAVKEDVGTKGAFGKQSIIRSQLPAGLSDGRLHL
jgi:hypothetical protein